MRDSIFAPTSGGGRAAVAVYRLSGPLSAVALQGLTGKALPSPRQAVLCRLRDKQQQDIDQALILWFPAPHSFTGEDVVELHLHGGRAVAQAVTRSLLDYGLRPAEPGEFSKRAFEAGKFDLTQAEAIADLVAADTAAQQRQALNQLQGRLGQLYDGWRLRLLQAQAHLEAAIDFADEDLPPGLIAQSQQSLAALAAEIVDHLEDGGRGERLRDGLRVVLLGAPNAGKSSLLNRVAGRDAAIVSATAGTTRDVIEIALDLSGFPLLLADTAGLREGREEIEQEGVKRARAQAAVADVKLVVFDGAAWPDLDQDSADLCDERTLILINKADLLPTPMPVPAMLFGRPVMVLSARTGQGIDSLLTSLSDWAARIFGGGDAPALTRSRHRAALQDAVNSLRRARQEESLPELVAEDVRVAARAIGKITGRVDVEAMLDIIFREFCIGK